MNKKIEMETQNPKKAKSAIKHVDRDVFGGETLRNSASGGTHAKKKRTLQGGKWLHVCMRSDKARGELSMLKPKIRQRIDAIVARSKRNSDVKISSWQNVGNHLHFSVKAPNRKAHNHWIRSISGLIARAVLAKERGSGPLKSPFWDSRPFTRIVRGWKGFDRLS